MSTLAIHLMQNMLSVEQDFGIEEQLYTNFFEKIESLCEDNPCHNKNHAANVTCSTLYFLIKIFLRDAYDAL